MRNNVTFVHPAEFVPVSDEDGILALQGATWFVEILRRVPGFALEGVPCQEDWGVVFFGSRNAKKFWVGLSFWPEGEQRWLAHVHHGSFAWLQRLMPSGNAELRGLIAALEQTLRSDPHVSMMRWYSEAEINDGRSKGADAAA